VFQYLSCYPEQTVTAVAEAVGISRVSATQSLRLLNSRGLLRVKRVGRWVVYSVGHDPLVSGSAELVRALRRRLGVPGDEVEMIFRDVTAFTHPRRAAIVSFLKARGSTELGALGVATGISRAALCRHLLKLQDRGVVRREKEGYVYIRPSNSLTRLLVQLACE